MAPLRRLGLIVHPTRALDGVLSELHEWAHAREIEVGQVRIEGQSRVVADPVEAGDCDLLVALGGDGTTLTALHAGARTGRAVLGVACGSVGVLTSVAAEHAIPGLEAVEADQAKVVDVPGVQVTAASGAVAVAINDLTVIRDGPNQLIVSIVVDDVLYARVAGDGLVVATALGSSAYTMAAGGPLLAPGAEGLALTPLAPHGGFCPPLVVAPDSQVALTIDPGHGGVRHEIDGQLAALDGEMLTVLLRPAYARLVELLDEEPRLTWLRARGLIADSPRVLVRDSRNATGRPGTGSP
jgi:NAD+ kinase